MPGLSAEKYQEMRALLDAPEDPDDPLPEAERTAMLAALEAHDNQSLEGWAKAGEAPPDGVIGADGAGGAAAVDPATLQAAAETGGVREQVEKARATPMGPPAPPAKLDPLLSLNPKQDIIAQALAVQPATTHKRGDKAAAEDWARSGGEDASGTVFVYEPSLASVRKRFLEDPTFARAMYTHTAPKPEEIMAMNHTSTMYQKAADHLWHEAAEAAAKNGKNAYRYSKAPWLHGGKAMSGIQTLGMKTVGSAVPASEGFESFILGVDNIAAFGAGRAVLETVLPGAKAELAELEEENPIPKFTGQVAGAVPGTVGLAGWGLADKLWRGITQAGRRGLPATAGLTRRAVNAAGSAGIAGGAHQAVQEGVDASANLAQTGETGTTAESALGRVGSAAGTAAALGGPMELLGSAAKAKADDIRWGPHFGGDVGRLEAGGTKFSVTKGVEVSPEVKALVQRGRAADRYPGDVMADQIAPDIYKAADGELKKAYDTVKGKQQTFAATPQGKARLPATGLVQRSVEVLDEMHAKTGKKLSSTQPSAGPRRVKLLLNQEVHRVSLKPEPGAVPMTPEQAEAYLKPRLLRPLMPKKPRAEAESSSGSREVDLGAKPSRGNAVLDRLDEMGVKSGNANFDKGINAGRSSPKAAPKSEPAELGIADSLNRRGIDKVYAVPWRRNAMEHESVIKGLKVKPGDDPDVMRQLKNAAREDRAPRGEEWGNIMKESSRLLGDRKALKKLVAPGGDSFKTIVGHGAQKPAELRRANALERAAGIAGKSKELQTVRHLDPMMRLQNDAGYMRRQGLARPGLGARLHDAARLRSFPVLRGLEGTAGPIRSGMGGRGGMLVEPDDIEDESELEDL
jgi:hypothetical protein